MILKQGAWGPGSGVPFHSSGPMSYQMIQKRLPQPEGFQVATEVIESTVEV